MGQRLNIEIKIGGKVQANAYYHWSAYTQSSIELTRQILSYDMSQLNSAPDLIKAIRLLEYTGAGLTDVEKNSLSDMYSGLEFSPCNGRNAGLIAVTEEGKKDTRMWEERRVTIDFDKKVVKFNVWWKGPKNNSDLFEESKADFELKQSPFYITFDRFDRFSKQNWEWFDFTYKNYLMSAIY